MNTLRNISILIFTVIALPICSWGQKTEYSSFPDMPIDENTKLVTYKKVVPMQGSSEELYNRAVAWANKYYRNPIVVITRADKTKGELECVSNISIYTLAKDGVTKANAGYVYYTLTIEAKENRYRYTITNLYKKESAQFPIERWLDASRPEWTAVRYDHLHQIDDAVKELMKSIEEGMKPAKVITDDW